MQNSDSSEIQLNSQQDTALRQMVDFVRDSDARVFILSGFAGTGKTTLLKNFICQLQGLGLGFILLASTGRAAKILRDKTGQEAKTVHSLIYQFEGFNRSIDEFYEEQESSRVINGSDKDLLLNFIPRALEAPNPGFCYIVDESSMISDRKFGINLQAQFGEGRLLSDLMEFDPVGKFVFVGDEAQLPPIGLNFSPALSPDYFRTEYGIEAQSYQLTQIMRQQGDNDLIAAADVIRRMYQNPPDVHKWGSFPLRKYKNIQIFPDEYRMICEYVKRIKSDGYSKAAFIRYSNAKCYELAQIVRPMLGFSDRLKTDELLLVTQNHVSGLMNGDLVVVNSLGGRVTLDCGISFIHAEVSPLDHTNCIEVLLCEDVLYGAQPNLSKSKQQALFVDFIVRMRKNNIDPNSIEFHENLKEDPYLNPLRAVFGYSLTCHKAQGGEWTDVFLDIPSFFSHKPKSPQYQWLYTAITRASEKLHISDNFFIK